jgi:hypothetical protein
MFERIVYVSRAVPGIGAAQTYDIIRHAHNRNQARGLTGALLLLDGWFVQALEGEPFRLQPCFERIARDPRHEALSLRLQVQAEQRLFPDQWMALRLGQDLPPGLLQQWDYEPGLPAARFDGLRLQALLQACCEHAAHAA